MTRISFVATAVPAMVVIAACGGGNTPPQGGPRAPGADRTAKTAALEAGANLLQAKAPVEKIAMYLNGFHVAKDDPTMQMKAHHYCKSGQRGPRAMCALRWQRSRSTDDGHRVHHFREGVQHAADK